MIGNFNSSLIHQITSFSETDSLKIGTFVEEYDELTQELKKENIFDKFLEQPITFAPYQRSKSQKKELWYPDRILFSGKDLIPRKYDHFTLKQNNGPIYLTTEIMFSRKSVFQILAKRDTITEKDDNGEFLEKTVDVEHWELSDFEFGETISMNQNYYIRKCFHKILKKEFAAKIIRPSKKSCHVLLREIQALMNIHSPFIMSHLQYFEEKFIVVIFDLLPYGDMFDYLKEKQKIPESDLKFYIANILLALKEIHAFNIAHRDLKPENIRFKSNGYLKLVGFHLCKSTIARAYTKCGTLDYIAPEVILNIGHTKGVDYWALGVLTYELLAGYPPFYSMDQTHMKLIDNIIKKRVIYPEFFSREAQSFIGGLLNKDKNFRLGCLKGGIEDIMNHPWLKEIDWKKLEKMEIKAPYIPERKPFEDNESNSTFEDFDMKMKHLSTEKEYNFDDEITPKVEHFMYGKLKQRFERGSLIINQGELVKIVSKNKENSEWEYEYNGKKFFSKPIDVEEMVLYENNNQKTFIRKRAFDTLQEFINTENAYVNYLNMIIEHYYQPLLEIITSDVHHKIFSSIQTIHKLNSTFLQKITVEIGNNERENFFKILEDFVKAFKLYTPYVQNYQTAYENIYNEKSKNPKFEKHLLTKSIFLVKHGLDDIFSLLIMPIQRLSRYQMLFQNIAKNSEGETRGFFEKIAKEMKEIVNYCNEKTREYDLSIKVFNLQRKYNLKIDNTQELLLEKKNAEEVYIEDEGKIRGIKEFSLLKNGTLLFELDSKKRGKIILEKFNLKETSFKDVQCIELSSTDFSLKILFEDEDAKKRWKELIQKL